MYVVDIYTKFVKGCKQFQIIENNVFCGYFPQVKF